MNVALRFVVIFCMASTLLFSAAATVSNAQDVELQSHDSALLQSPTQPAMETHTGSGAPQIGSQPADDDSQKSGTSNDRLFWTLPNFLVVENSMQAPPLESKAKYKLVLRTSFDWAQLAYTGFVAGIGQAQNSEPGYGQGSAGYFKRFASSFADNTDENFWTAAILPSLLHQDPRYFQLGQGRFLHRFGYAVTRQLITRNDAGRREFNFSEVGGSCIAAAISNLYHPVDDRTFANTLSVWGTLVGWDTVGSVVKEFWPDIRRKFTKH